jgi:hypothetical protein
MQTVSFTVQSWYDPHAGGMCMRVVRVDNKEEVDLRETSLLVRVTIDEVHRVHRCLIRHLASGREAHLQGGQGLAAFVKACMLDDGPQLPQAPNRGT